ncbi:MAG: flagellar export chaperone FliS [Pseudomonadota bacterium]
MNASNQQALDDYRSVHVTADIANASPHRLIQMLMDRLMVNLHQGARAMAAGKISEKGERLGDAIAIIDCLRTSLDFGPSKDIAGKLESLYDYSIREVLKANLEDDVSRVERVAEVLGEIKSAWDAIDS